jgi:hypothetical protein
MKEKGRTRKPCDLCHKTPETYSTRAVGDVCDECRKEWERLKRIEIESLKGQKNQKIFLVAEREYALPYIGQSYNQRDYDPNPSMTETDSDKIRRCLHKLIMLHGVEQKGYPSKFIKLFKKQNGWDFYIKAPSEPMYLIKELYDLIEKFREREYNAGVEKGKSFIAMMASGEITMQEMDVKLEAYKPQR